jgi:hypothetical protein
VLKISPVKLLNLGNWFNAYPPLADPSSFPYIYNLHCPLSNRLQRQNFSIYKRKLALSINNEIAPESNGMTAARKIEIAIYLSPSAS